MTARSADSSASNVRVALVGGPFDGAELRCRVKSPAFGFVGGDSPRVQMFAMPGVGRVLYRQVGVRKYMFAGFTHAHCPGCGGFNDLGSEPQERCGFCGVLLKDRSGPM